MKSEFSVIIPLYNKQAEIGRALESVLSQSVAPLEVIVVNDGSTDGSREVLANYDSLNIKIIDQKNAGVSVARNHGAAIAAGHYLAFLDGDDWWEPQYLEKMAQLIEKYPGCGAYSSAFNIVSAKNTRPVKSPKTEGVIKNFFREAMFSYICQPSATIIPADIFSECGGFPPGMKIGEDLYLWIEIASRFKICFTPELLVNYCRTASNRSAGIYSPEITDFSFYDFFRPNDKDSWRNEYIARCAIGKALTLTAKGDTKFGRITEAQFSYTKFYRRGWRKLWILNRLPTKIRPAVHRFYNYLAWKLAKKGF